MNINLDPLPDRTSEDVRRLVEIELGKISNPIIMAGLKSFLIQPRMEMRDWGWHLPIRSFPVWLIAKSQQYDYGIVYSDYGFGPESPWGLVFLSHNNFDADYCWFNSLEGAYTDSRLIEEFKETPK